ncbi:MAG: hypothetical protein AAF750_02445 [Planctomycetota bacterium]
MPAPTPQANPNPPTAAPVEDWLITAYAPHADATHLARETNGQGLAWLPLQADPERPGHWSATIALTPGTHRLRYYAQQDGTYLNCGAAGLTAHRLSSPVGSVHVELATNRFALAI